MNLTQMQKDAIVRAIMQDMPPIDAEARADAIRDAILKAMSPEIRKLYDRKPHALRTASVLFVDPGRMWAAEVVVGDVSKEKLDAITRPYATQEAERDQMRKRLFDAFKGIRTLKQAEATFPEFKKYYPTEAQPTKNLPALANVVGDLCKLGWPKKG